MRSKPAGIFRIFFPVYGTGTVNQRSARFHIGLNRIQNLRKSSGFEITDKVNVTILTNEQMDGAIQAYKEYISNQVLAASVEIADYAISDAVELDFEEFKLSVKVEKAE